ncbi:DUF4862 family protein [Georgenia yuyongxinii]|uniref:DUF4862 family protein n=1 Tax=Georgenia yuyongxinii TaxID=2589797 RepID=A0A552WQT3_9MICO|nr:DUF4862 family protein [Georgenia yuyongxinii]
MARSLEEALSWDLAGAAVVVEHCDARVPGQEPAKGFFPLADELEVLGGLGGRVGAGINWGRSAIEGRGAATATQHVAAAARARLLRALIFSGAAAGSTAWGPAWEDGHLPPRGADAALAASADSLLGAQEVRAALAAAAGADLILGAKVAVRPLDADVATRLAVARATLEMVAGGADPGQRGATAV